MNIFPTDLLITPKYTNYPLQLYQNLHPKSSVDFLNCWATILLIMLHQKQQEYLYVKNYPFFFFKFQLDIHSCENNSKEHLHIKGTFWLINAYKATIYTLKPTLA